MEKGTLMLKMGLGVLMIAILAVGAFLVSALVADKGSGSFSATQARQIATAGITEQQAITIAKSVAQGNVADVEFDGRAYLVEIDDGKTENEVTVDATTGSILKVVEETELGRKELDVVNPKVSEEQAIEIALRAIPGTFTEIEAARVNDVYVYEVEIQSEGQETDVLVNMMTGKIEGIERDAIEEDDEDDSSDELDDEENDAESEEEEIMVSSAGARVSEQQAKDIAIREVGGRVTDIETDSEDGRNVWEVEIRKDGEEVDVLIDMETGEVLDIERE